MGYVHPFVDGISICGIQTIKKKMTQYLKTTNMPVSFFRCSREALLSVQGHSKVMYGASILKQTDIKRSIEWDETKKVITSVFTLEYTL